jgi:hypothetical protein
MRAYSPAPLPLDARITLERPAPDRLLIRIERRRARVFSLGLDEAAYLAELIRLELAPRGGAAQSRSVS